MTTWVSSAFGSAHLFCASAVSICAIYPGGRRCCAATRCARFCAHRRRFYGSGSACCTYTSGPFCLQRAWYCHLLCHGVSPGFCLQDEMKRHFANMPCTVRRSSTVQFYHSEERAVCWLEHYRLLKAGISPVSRWFRSSALALIRTEVSRHGANLFSACYRGGISGGTTTAAGKRRYRGKPSDCSVFAHNDMLPGGGAPLLLAQRHTAATPLLAATPRRCAAWTWMSGMQFLASCRTKRRTNGWRGARVTCRFAAGRYPLQFLALR